MCTAAITILNLQQVSTETCLEDADLSKTQPCKYFVYVDQEYGKCKTLCVTVQFLLCFILNLRAISEYKPWGGMYLEGQFIRHFFCIMSLVGLYLEGFIHGVAYFQNFTVFHVCKCTLAYLSRDQIYRHLYRQKLILILIHVPAVLYLVQRILSQRHQLISTIPTTVPLL